MCFFRTLYLELKTHSLTLSPSHNSPSHNSPTTHNRKITVKKGKAEIQIKITKKTILVLLCDEPLNEYRRSKLSSKDEFQ